MHLPESVIPILRETVSSPVLPLGLPLEIWKAPDHRTWVDAFLELGVSLSHSDLSEEGLPRGYILVAHIFHWEAACQSEAWHAFDNESSSVARVIACYREVGLHGEADALSRAFGMWQSSDGDSTLTSKAYNALSHSYSVDFDRMEYLACYFVDNAQQLFYLPSAT